MGGKKKQERGCCGDEGRKGVEKKKAIKERRRERRGENKRRNKMKRGKRKRKGVRKWEKEERRIREGDFSPTINESVGIGFVEPRALFVSSDS